MNGVDAEDESGQRGRPEDPLSRRAFLRNSAAGLGAVSAAGASRLAVGDDASIPSIRLADAFQASLAEDPSPGAFEGQGMSGAEVFARLCSQEQLAALFCCPGNYTVINALAAAGIPSYGGRTEGSMCAMADGFARASGEVSACSGTEGPGFTHMIMNIAAAHRARTPLLVLASNMQIAGDDREAFIQTGYQQPHTEGIRKYGKRLIDPGRVHEYGAYAFRHLKTGVPGPVHLDFPAEVARARFTSPSELRDFHDKSRYRSESRPHPDPDDMRRCAALLDKAERPLIVAGQGVYLRRAWQRLIDVAERADIGLVSSGPTRGFIPDDHPLTLAAAPDALLSADLVVFVGQYCMPSPGEYRFNPDIKAVRVHPEPEDLGRNWPLELGIVADEAAFVDALADTVRRRRRPAWRDEIAAARLAYQGKVDKILALGIKHSDSTGLLHPAVIAHDTQAFVEARERDAIAIGVGGWTIGLFSGHFVRAYRPGQLIVPGYQYAAIGPDMAMMMGACAAVQRGAGIQAPYQGTPTVCITSDAGMAYSLFELDTALKYRLPTITVVYNNNCWGVWPNAARSARSMHMYLFQENLRYDRMAEGLGAYGAYVRNRRELQAALQEAWRLARDQGLSSLINCQGLMEFTSGRHYPPGISLPHEPGVGAVAH